MPRRYVCHWKFLFQYSFKYCQHLLSQSYKRYISKNYFTKNAWLFLDQCLYISVTFCYITITWLKKRCRIVPLISILSTMYRRIAFHLIYSMALLTEMYNFYFLFSIHDLPKAKLESLARFLPLVLDKLLLLMVRPQLLPSGIEIL